MSILKKGYVYSHSCVVLYKCRYEIFFSMLSKCCFSIGHPKKPRTAFIIRMWRCCLKTCCCCVTLAAKVACSKLLPTDPSVRPSTHPPFVPRPANNFRYNKMDWKFKKSAKNSDSDSAFLILWWFFMAWDGYYQANWD